ncbi:MAG: DNA polymerase III subunit delta [Bacteroidetes bacterium]|nr:DNA polymerase III subunit delta [Bacteroidota bacterium]
MGIFDLNKIKTKDDFPSVLLLYGKDTFTLNEYYNKIIAFLVADEDSKTDFELIDGEENNINNLLALALQLPMLSDKRIIAVRRFDNMFSGRKKKKTENTPFNHYLANPNPSTILILLVEDTDTSSKNKVDNSKEPYDIILSKHSYKEFTQIKENKFTAWIIDRFKQKNITIEQKSAELIVANCHPNLMDIANEIDKISLHYIGQNNILYDEILYIIGYTRSNTIFDLTNAIYYRNMKKAVSIFHNIMKKAGEENVIIYQLASLFYKLYKLIELKGTNKAQNEIARELEIHQYYLSNYMTALQNYSVEEITAAIILINDTDYKLKSMRIDKRLLVEELLVKILEKV